MKLLEELTLREFIDFYKFGNATGGQLTYRTNWLIKRAKILGLRLIFNKKGRRFIVGVHQQFLTGRQLQNPLFSEDSYGVGVNHLIDKHNYNKDNSREENLAKLNRRGYVYYRLCSDLKGFIFSLIKKHNTI